MSDQELIEAIIEIVENAFQFSDDPNLGRQIIHEIRLLGESDDFATLR